MCARVSGLLLCAIYNGGRGGNKKGEERKMRGKLMMEYTCGEGSILFDLAITSGESTLSHLSTTPKNKELFMGVPTCSVKSFVTTLKAERKKKLCVPKKAGENESILVGAQIYKAEEWSTYKIGKYLLESITWWILR